MSKQVVESPEWTRLYWVVMAIIGLMLLNSLFSCTPEPAPCTECPEDYVAKYWFVWAVPVVLFGWIALKVKATLPRILFGFLSLLCFCLLVVPYCLMFILWVLIELFP